MALGALGWGSDTLWAHSGHTRIIRRPSSSRLIAREFEAVDESTLVAGTCFGGSAARAVNASTFEEILMRRSLAIVVCIGVVGLCPSLATAQGLRIGVSGVAYGQDALSPSEAAIQATDNFMKAFNAKDAVEWAATLNYPHVRFSNGAVTTWNSEEEYAETTKKRFPTLIANGWHHTVLVKREVTLSSEDKIHVSIEFERFNADDDSLGVFQALYIVTNVDGHWGIQGISTITPY